MSLYAWVIDTDDLYDTDLKAGLVDDPIFNAAGACGPSDAPDELLTLLKEDGSFGAPFRMYDDDGELYYSGRIAGEYEGDEPLVDFGTPNAGATEIRYLTNGQWEAQ